MSIKAKNWRIIDLINWGVTHFTAKGINNARLEIEWLLCDLLTCNRVDLYLKFENTHYYLVIPQLKNLTLNSLLPGSFWGIPILMGKMLKDHH